MIRDVRKTTQQGTREARSHPPRRSEAALLHVITELRMERAGLDEELRAAERALKTLRLDSKKTVDGTRKKKIVLKESFPSSPSRPYRHGITAALRQTMAETPDGRVELKDFLTAHPEFMRESVYTCLRHLVRQNEVNWLERGVYQRKGASDNEGGK